MQQALKHERIRFGRDDIVDLAALPSAAACGHELLREGRRPWLRRVALKASGLLVGVVVLLAAGLCAVGFSGIGSERLRSEAEKALRGAVGPGLMATVGPAELRFDLKRFLAVEVRDVSLKRAGDNARVVDAGHVRFGIPVLPLLFGNLRLSEAELADARIVTAMLPRSSGDWTASLRNEEGLIDPDLTTNVLFAAIGGLFDAVERQALDEIDLDNIEFVFPATSPVSNLRIVSGSLAQAGGGTLTASIALEADGRAAAVEGTASRDGATRRISSLALTVESPDTHPIIADDGAVTLPAPAPSGPLRNRVGSLSLSVTGSQATGDAGSNVAVDVRLASTALDLGARGILRGDIGFRGNVIAGTNKIDVKVLKATLGRNIFDFYGSIGPRPPTDEADDEPAYRFDLISPKTVLSPETSLEPALATYIRTAGAYLVAPRRLSVDEVAISAGQGELLVTAAVDFVAGKVPGMAAAFSVKDMPVGHVKQLWPWFTARSARDWVLKNFFGGIVTTANVQFKVPPGRLGNGVALDAREVSGRFEIAGSRFNTTGLVPPMRDAVGAVDFRGTDIDVSLKSGTVYLPSGRTVDGSNAVLAIRNSNIPPVVGKLEIDVKGEAAAVAELATFEPINALRFIGLQPEDFSGQVSGHVTSDVPLQKAYPRELIDWRVALDFDKLSLARPIDGQRLTDATGRVDANPQEAAFSARGMLGGMPAEIDTIEPIRSGKPRDRKVRIVLDDKTRDRIAPGLAGLITGTVKLDVDASGKGERRMRADLSNAQLDLPWAGWSKGAGIAASTDFVLKTDGDKATLSNFSLSGKSFGIKGSINLSKGALDSAKFGSVQLNRDDDVAVSVKRSGKGYAVSVTGDSLDARALVKQFTKDTDTASNAASGAPISVSVDIGSVGGFNSERLSNVKLDYRGAGSRVIALKVDATTKAGAPVDIRSGSEDGGRTMRMQSTDAGAILRFLDIYQNMEGGSIAVALRGGADGPMSGQIDARNFALVNEPKLGSLVSNRPQGSDRSLNEAVKRDLDTSRVKFDRAYTQIDKGSGYLKLANGVLRGSQIGATFQGTLYDARNNMDMTGTFMPAYGLNRLFGELPLVGVILGNGRDRGLLGVTFRLTGKASAPDLQINPLSVIAPGIFRSIFEFQ